MSGVDTDCIVINILDAGPLQPTIRILTLVTVYYGFISSIESTTVINLNVNIACDISWHFCNSQLAMNSEIVHKLNDMTKELTSQIDNSESRLFSKLEHELKPLVNQTFEKILDATIARYHARISEMFEKDSASLSLSHQKMDYMIQEIQSVGNEVKDTKLFYDLMRPNVEALHSRLEKLESKLESITQKNEKLKASLRINSDKSMESEDSATTEKKSVSESDTTDESSILELDESDRIQVSDTAVMFSRKKLTKHDNVYEGEMSSDLLGIRRCAIKFPRESSQRDEEVMILGKLGSHSHVNCLIQSGVFDDGLIKSRFLVLELCHKENLDQFLRNRPYNLQQRLEYCTQIIKGMNYIHKKMIIHKDLKPANILLALDNLQCIKIADFGISQEIQSERSMVYCENCFGTIGYHPPESFGNDHISLKSDIFSLGVVFYFVMNKEESPFGPASDLWDSNIKKGIVDVTLQFVPNPIAFAHLFKLMMSKDRRWRPTIRQVEKHPCWTLKEENCDFDYGFMDEVDLCSEKRESSQLEGTDSIDDHGRLNEMLSILDPIENKIKEKSSKEMKKEKSISQQRHSATGQIGGVSFGTSRVRNYHCDPYRLRVDFYPDDDDDDALDMYESTTETSTAMQRSVEFSDADLKEIHDMEIGTMVEVPSTAVGLLNNTGPLYGVIRWIGKLEEEGDTAVGIELESTIPNGHAQDGWYNGVQYYSCEAGKGHFVFLKFCRKDMRFV